MRRIHLKQRPAPQWLGALRQLDQFWDVGGAGMAGEALGQAGAVVPCEPDIDAVEQAVLA